MNKTKKLALGGLLIALVTVSTMAIKIPMVATSGYIHAGDSMIYLAGVLFGPQFGLLAAGLGSALADLLSGYSHWALPTLIIKGLEGYIIGKIAIGIGNRNSSLEIRDIIAVLVGGAWMVVGYLIAGAIITKSWTAALSSITGNIGQAIGGTVIALPLIYAILKTDLIHNIQDN